jgi:hypothetical protein
MHLSQLVTDATEPPEPGRRLRVGGVRPGDDQTGSGLPSACSVSSHRRAAVAGSLAEA